MDYLKQMSDTGVIDFDEMDDRINEMHEKQKAQQNNDEHVTIGDGEDTADEEEVTGQSPTEPDQPDAELTEQVNDALRKVQENQKREIQRLEKAHENLKAHLDEVKEELRDLTDDHERTRDQVKRLSDPPAEAPDDVNNDDQTVTPDDNDETTPQASSQPTTGRTEPEEEKTVDPKTSDYDSDDVALEKVFNTDKTL